MAKSKISQAMELVAKGYTRYAAAMATGLQPSAVYRQVKKLESKAAGKCPACGAALKKGKSSKS
jgi:hypothetical protein